MSSSSMTSHLRLPGAGMTEKFNSSFYLLRKENVMMTFQFIWQRFPLSSPWITYTFMSELIWKQGIKEYKYLSELVLSELAVQWSKKAHVFSRNLLKSK